MSYFIPQRYNESYNQKVKKNNLFCLVTSSNLSSQATTPLFGIRNPTPTRTRSGRTSAGRLGHQTTCTPRQATLFRGQTCRIHRLPKRDAGDWLARERNLVGLVGSGWVWFFLKQQGKQQRNCSFKKLYIVDQLTPSNKNWHGSLRNSGPPKKKRRFPVWGMLIFRGFFKRSNPQQNATHLCPLDLNGLKIPPKKRPVKSWATKKKWQIK